MITPQQALVRLIEQREIFYDEMLSLMRQIMGGEVSPTMIAAILVGLRVKKETIGEISAAAFVMREFSTKVPVTKRQHLVEHLWHRRRCRAHLQYFHCQCLRRLGGRRTCRETWRTISVLYLRFGRCVGSVGREPQSHPSAGRAKCGRDWHRFYVRAQFPRCDEACRASAQRIGRTHHLQRIGPPHQSSWC